MSWSEGLTRPSRERSVTKTNSSRSVWQDEVKMVSPLERDLGGMKYYLEATGVAGIINIIIIIDHYTYRARRL